MTVEMSVKYIKTITLKLSSFQISYTTNWLNEQLVNVCPKW